jgi:hypothetical protein
MGRFVDLLGTTLTSFQIGKATLSDAGGSARTLTLPGLAGTIPRLEDSDPAYISGFTHSSTATVVTVGGGVVWNPGVSQYITSGGDVLTNSGLASNTQYYCYIDNAGVLSLSTTAPTVYAGTAASMTGNASQRFLFPIHTATLSASFNLQSSDAGASSVWVTFLHNIGTTSRLVSAGGSTTAAAASAVAFAPPNFTKVLCVKVQNTAAGTTSSVRPYVYTGAAFTIFSSVAFSSTETFEIPCDTTPKIQYDVTVSGVANVDLLGYLFFR